MCMLERTHIQLCMLLIQLICNFSGQLLCCVLINDFVAAGVGSKIKYFFLAHQEE